MTRVHLLIAGRVQGVYYRASAKTEADRLGVAGWVRNRADGSVELVAEGSLDAIEQLVAWCRRGPPMARVEQLEPVFSEPVGLEEGFHVRPTC